MKKPAKNNMGIAIAMGAGIGLVIGPAFFDNPGFGMCIGAGLGIIWGSVNKPKKAE